MLSDGSLDEFYEKGNGVLIGRRCPFLVLGRRGAGMNMKFMPAGDEAMVVEFGNVIDEETNFRVHALAAFVHDREISGVREVLPTFRSLMIFYDSDKTTYRKLTKELRHFKGNASGQEQERRRTLMVPCCYDSVYGPDLEGTAADLSMSGEELIWIHTERDYKIYMLGFLPGFVYLGGLDERIHAPRLKIPRTEIPARSVGIGGSQTGVYPIKSPGGWRLIGSTPLDFYNPQNDTPILCKAGEYIRFYPISKEEYGVIRRDVESGLYKPEYV